MTVGTGRSKVVQGTSGNSSEKRLGTSLATILRWLTLTVILSTQNHVTKSLKFEEVGPSSAALNHRTASVESSEFFFQ